MNREEAIDFGHFWLEVNDEAKINKDFKSRTYEFFETVIEELEKDTVPFDFDLYQAGLMDMPEEMIKVLNKIKAEIEQKRHEYRTDGDFNECTRFGLLLACEIIDKYITREVLKQETEEDENE